MAPSPYIFIISIGPVDMNQYARFDEIPSMSLKDIKETKRYGRTYGRTYGWTDGQRENSIPTHKHSLRGYKNCNILHRRVIVMKKKNGIPPEH